MKMVGGRKENEMYKFIITFKFIDEVTRLHMTKQKIYRGTSEGAEEYALDLKRLGAYDVRISKGVYQVC